MAIQGIKLMEQLKDIHGDEGALDHKVMAVGSQCSEGPLHVPLDGLFALDELSFEFSPAPDSTIDVYYGGPTTITITVSLMAGELPVFSRTLREKCKLIVEAEYRDSQHSSPVSSERNSPLHLAQRSSASSARNSPVYTSYDTLQ